MSLFQSNLRKQIRNLPNILNFVKQIHYYSKLFTSLLSFELRGRTTDVRGLVASAKQPSTEGPLRGSLCGTWVREATYDPEEIGRSSPKFFRDWINEYSLIHSQTLRILRFLARIFDEFFPGFRAKFQKLVTCVAFSIKFANTNQKFAENSEFCENNSQLFKIIHWCP